MHVKNLRIEDIAKIRESQNFLKKLSDALSYETGSSWDFVYSIGNDDKLNNAVLYKEDKFECKDIHNEEPFFLKENENAELKMKENTPNILHFTYKTNAKCAFYFVNVEMPAHKKDDNWTVWYKEAEVLKKIYDFLSKKGATIMGGYFHATPTELKDENGNILFNEDNIHSCGQPTIITKPNSKNQCEELIECNYFILNKALQNNLKASADRYIVWDTKVKEDSNKFTMSMEGFYDSLSESIPVSIVLNFKEN